MDVSGGAVACRGTTVRIGLIAPPWLPVPPPAYGGTEAVVDRLARGLRAAGHEVVLFTTGDGTCPVDRRWVFEQAQGARMGEAVAELRHLVHAYEAVAHCDVVHDHTVIGPTYAGRFPALPVVTTNHGPFVGELLDVYRAVAHRVPVIAISHAQARGAAGLPLAGVIHHGIDVERFPKGSGDGGYLLFLGRMTPDKGAEQAIRVARRAGLPLVLAAKMREAPERRYFEERVRPLLGRGVEFVGEVGGAEKVELLGAATALVNPIQWDEPFGLVMIEALACGTPVLAMRRGAAPEIVDPGLTGALGDDEEDLARAVDGVAALDRAACRSAVEARFSTTRMVAEHLELFRRILAAREAGRRTAGQLTRSAPAALR
jgi:glycosyltransferase involved in cell wall biosynthesis